MLPDQKKQAALLIGFIKGDEKSDRCWTSLLCQKYHAKWKKKVQGKQTSNSSEPGCGHKEMRKNSVHVAARTWGSGCKLS